MNLGVSCKQFDPFDGKCLFAFDHRIPIIWEIGFLVSWDGSVWGYGPYRKYSISDFLW